MATVPYVPPRRNQAAVMQPLTFPRRRKEPFVSDSRESNGGLLGLVGVGVVV